MQQQVYSDEYVKVRDGVNHARKVMWLTLGGLFLGMIILAAIKSFLWDSFVIDIIVYSFIIPACYVVYRWARATEMLEKILPKKDYLLIQTSDKQFKKVKWFFGILGIISLLSVFGIIVIQFLYDNQWIQFHVTDYAWIMLASLASFMGNIGALQFVYALREQYLKVKEKEQD